MDGQSVMDIGPESRGVAMAFRTSRRHGRLRKHRQPLRARGLKDQEIKRRVNDIAALLRIDHVLDHTPRQLSNGQKQRTSLARSLVHGPSVLMLDDPLRNVDAKIRYEMRLELPRIFRQYQSTVLYVTQDSREALALGDRIGVLLDGSFQQIDTPAGVYRGPNNQRIGVCSAILPSTCCLAVAARRRAGIVRAEMVVTRSRCRSAPQPGRARLRGIRRARAIWLRSGARASRSNWASDTVQCAWSCCCVPTMRPSFSPSSRDSRLDAERGHRRLHASTSTRRHFDSASGAGCRSATRWYHSEARWCTSASRPQPVPS